MGLKYMKEYREYLELGKLQVAYRGLMRFMKDLKRYFEENHPDYKYSSTIYSGNMDLTFFSFTTRKLVNEKLKIVVVFLHEKFRFEIWLAGINRQVQKKWWLKIQEMEINEYKVLESIKGKEGIVESVLIENPDFGNLEPLTKTIDNKTLKFIQSMENLIN